MAVDGREVDGRCVWEVNGRWMGGGWNVDAVSAASVYGYVISIQSEFRCRRRRAKAKTFRHEGFPGDSSA